MNDKPEDIFIVPGAASCVASTLPPTVWISDNFAQDWFADAVRESKIPQDHNARRREIIFAVCFLESYIFEWTRQMLNSDELNNYFPLRHKPRRNLRAKWDKIPKDLYTDKKIPCSTQVRSFGA